MPFSIPEVSDIYEDIVLRVGYSSSDAVIEPIIQEIVKSTEIALSSINPDAVYKTASTLNDITADAVIGEELKIESKKLAALVSSFVEPSFIAAFALTLGEELSGNIESLQNQFITVGHVFSVGKCIVPTDGKTVGDRKRIYELLKDESAGGRGNVILYIHRNFFT